MRVLRRLAIPCAAVLDLCRLVTPERRPMSDRPHDVIAEWHDRTLVHTCQICGVVTLGVGPPMPCVPAPSCMSCGDGGLIIMACSAEGVSVELELTEDPRGAWSCRSCERSYRVHPV